MLAILTLFAVTHFARHKLGTAKFSIAEAQFNFTNPYFKSPAGGFFLLQ
jgi:hypothetical protein